ncbi:MAG: HDIG domain-containing protein [Bacteroidales bacterium]|jgi:putative nucleotidyltransferase with HDIG domain|nr:HDIG domain-containing protein [Bacteroidales bacterium]MCI2121840.1 HDIG domain-containing protein [Bacteroidales bacterium]MCI2146038.1 HDIG domain-containing protein [Bacteroidales bacterium]
MPTSTHNPLKNYRLYVALALVFVITFIFYPREGKFPYQYQKGSSWTYETLISPFDFPILKTESELLKEKEEKASEVIPYYTYHSDFTGRIDAFDRQRGAVDSTETYNKVTEVVNSALRKIYEKGVVSSFEGEDISDKVIFVQKDKRAVETPAIDVFDVDDAKDYIKGRLKAETDVTNLDTLMQTLHLENYIAPNLIYDSRTTESIHREAVDYISPTSGMFYAGQLIVSKGEIITSDIEQLLNSYKAEYENNYGYSGSTLALRFGQAIILLAVIALLFILLFLSYPEAFSHLNQFYYFLMLFLLAFLTTVALQHYRPSLLYLVPYTVTVLYLLSFFPSKIVFPIYAVILLPVLFVANNGTTIFFMNLVAGAILIISYRKFNRGWLQFVNSLIVFAVMLAIYLAFIAISSVELKPDYHIILLIFLNSLLVVACFPLSLLFEKIFGLLSKSRLFELSDTNNPLMQLLAQKAPGTFQHSLQVANLAEAAARKIGANTMLVRVGALYHDIGKIENPQCFIENQAPGVDYHKGLSPKESAALIIKHVDDGVVIAKKYNLPQVVIDFIRTHHGKSQTLYFYNKYCNDGGNPDDIAEFTYHGDYPWTKEQVIIMMADAVEASSRSLKDYSAKSISSLVDKIVGMRLSGDQLSCADISIKDINIVTASFKNDLQRVYHARIAYPERKK